jgi:hypothetical protein
MVSAIRMCAGVVLTPLTREALAHLDSLRKRIIGWRRSVVMLRAPQGFESRTYHGVDCGSLQKHLVSLLDAS